MQSLYLIRHCQSTGQQPDGALTGLGQKQAQDLTTRLTRIQPDALFSSPYHRAIDTLRPYAELTNAKIALDNDLIERRLKPIGEVRPDWLDHVRRSFDDRDYHLKGGESLNQTCDRAMRALVKIAELGYAQPVVATHGNLIASVLGSVNSSYGFDDWQIMKNPHIFALKFSNGSLISYTDLN